MQPSRGPSVRGLKQVFMLQRADHGNRRFGTLVLVHARWGEAIEATVAFVVEHRNPCIVVAAKPGGREGKGVEPKVVVGEMPRTGAGVCNTGDLDGLLVERRLRVVRSSTPNRGDRQTSVVGFATHQPFEKIETRLDVVDRTGSLTGREQRLGDEGIVVRQTILGPRPRAIGTHHVAHLFARVVEKERRVVVVRVDSGHFCGAERRVTHRANRGSPVEARVVEGALCLAADVVVETEAGRGAECPESATPAVVGRRGIDPHALETETVADHSRLVNCVVDEVECDTTEHLGPERSAAVVKRRDREAGIVVGAVPEAETGVPTLGVFQNAAVVGEAGEVTERDAVRVV